MEESFDPPPRQPLTVGIIYNLKKGVHSDVPDAEAEYDNIETVHAIEAALREGGHRTVLLEADGSLPERLRTTRLDIAFNIAEGISGRGREAQVPALLHYYGIPFTGSDETTLCVALDKALTKRLLLTHRIPTPRYAVLTPDTLRRLPALPYPVIVKPVAEGSSKGISEVSVVKNREELRTLAAANLAAYRQDLLAEAYIAGREFTVGLLGNGEDLRVFTPMEICFKKPTQGAFHVYSYPVKQDYTRYVSYACPADISPGIEQEMVRLSRKIYRALSCRDFARIDFRVSEEGKVCFIEINPLPGLAPGYSDYPMAAAFCGMDYAALVQGILHAACRRLGIG
ncbi:MAG: ATP-grasp domain-containing protein [Eubacteriales bacterium]